MIFIVSHKICNFIALMVYLKCQYSQQTYKRMAYEWEWTRRSRRGRTKITTWKEKNNQNNINVCQSFYLGWRLIFAFLSHTKWRLWNFRERHSEKPDRKYWFAIKLALRLWSNYNIFFRFDQTSFQLMFQLIRFDQIIIKLRHNLLISFTPMSD